MANNSFHDSWTNFGAPKRGKPRSAHTGTKGSNSITLKYGSGRSDTFWGASSGGPIGKNHGHTVRYNGFPVYSRQPGPKKQQQRNASRLFKY